MQAPKSMVGIFNAIQANRNEAILATHGWGVFGVTTKKVLYKKPSGTFKTQEEAEKKALYMEKLNPGKKFIAKELY